MSKSTSSPPERYLRLRQVLEIYPVCKQTWYAQVADGTMPQPAIRTGKRCVFWRESEVLAAIEAHAVKPAAA